jgi:hypothetical protein
MGKLSFTIAAACMAVFTAAASAQTRQRPAPQGEEGFFRPAADPALTTTHPPVTAPRARRNAPVSPAQPPSAAAVEAAEEIRKAEEAQMDRVEVEHAVARTEVVTRTPAITSPLDRTAPIMSPLDGTAPIISPVSR